MRLTIETAQAGRWCARVENDGAAGRVLALAGADELWALLREIFGGAVDVPAETPGAAAGPVSATVDAMWEKALPARAPRRRPQKPARVGRDADRRFAKTPAFERLAELVAAKGGRERWVRVTTQMAIDELQITSTTALKAGHLAVDAGLLAHHHVHGSKNGGGSWYCVPPERGGTAGPWGGESVVGHRSSVEENAGEKQAVGNRQSAAGQSVVSPRCDAKPAAPKPAPKPAEAPPAPKPAEAPPAPKPAEAPPAPQKIAPRPRQPAAAKLAITVPEAEPTAAPGGLRPLSTPEVAAIVGRRAEPVRPLTAAQRGALLRRPQPALPERPAGTDSVRAALAASQFNGEGAAFRLSLKALGQNAGLPSDRLPNILAWLGATGAIDHQPPERGQVLHRFTVLAAVAEAVA